MPCFCRVGCFLKKLLHFCRMCVIIKKIKKGVKTHMEFPSTRIHTGHFLLQITVFIICAVKSVWYCHTGELTSSTLGICCFIGAMASSGSIWIFHIWKCIAIYFFYGPRHQCKKRLPELPSAGCPTYLGPGYAISSHLHDIKNELSRTNNRNRYR